MKLSIVCSILDRMLKVNSKCKCETTDLGMSGPREGCGGREVEQGTEVDQPVRKQFEQHLRPPEKRNICHVRCPTQSII